LRLEHVESMRMLLAELLRLPGEDMDEEGGGMALMPVGRYTLLELLHTFSGLKLQVRAHVPAARRFERQRKEPSVLLLMELLLITMQLLIMRLLLILMTMMMTLMLMLLQMMIMLLAGDMYPHSPMMRLMLHRSPT